MRTLNLTRFGAVIGVGGLALLACSGDDDGGGSGATVLETETETRSVDIGHGRTMFLECMGEGSPTVILESGIHDSSEYWSVSQPLAPAVDPPVMQGLATTNRVCRYDRPGTIVPGDPPAITDRSTPVAMPRTVGDSVADLHALLDAADEDGLYVVVAKSWGGMIGQLYARTYPQDVAGLVLVDAFAPVLRDAGMTTADLEAVWPQAQDSLVQLRPNTPHEIATGSIHYIQVTEPDLVIAAARLVINRNTAADHPPRPVAGDLSGASARCRPAVVPGRRADGHGCRHHPCTRGTRGGRQPVSLVGCSGCSSRAKVSRPGY